MTDDIDALEAAARAATPGPWDVEAETYSPFYSPDVLSSGRIIVQTICSDMTRMEDAANAAYIAALHPSAALALIARVRRAEAALREIGWCEDDGRPGPDLRSCITIARAALEARTDGE